MRRCATTAVLLASALAVSACGATGLLEKTTEAATPETANTAASSSFAFDVASDVKRDVFADRLASHALRCWVRDDPTYRVGGPFEEGSNLDVTLIYLGDDPADVQQQEALRLTVPTPKDGVYAVSATGPLATAEHHPRLAQGLELAAAGAKRCN